MFPDGLQYLTTVIPYEKKGHPPSIEDLQILTKSMFFPSEPRSFMFVVAEVQSLIDPFISLYVLFSSARYER